MKIFSLRNILGVAAIYGVTQYAKKQGGFRPALDNVMDKLRNLGQQAEQQIGGRERMGGEEVGAHISSPSDVSTASSFGTGGYTGSGSEGAVSGEIGGNTGGGSTGGTGQPR